MSLTIQNYIQEWHLDQYLNPTLLASLGRYHRDVDEMIDFSVEISQLYFLVEGSVNVAFYHANGKGSVVGTLRPLSVLGDLDLFHDPNLLLNVIAIEPSTFLTLPQSVALEYGSDDPKFLRFIIQQLSDKLTKSTALLKYNVLPLNGQIAAYLVENQIDQQVQLPSKPHFAELMGTTVRHLNRVLNKFIADNVIAIDGDQLTILDESELEALL